MTTTIYKPFLTDTQWKDVINLCNDNEKKLLRLFANNYRQVTQSMVLKEFPQHTWHNIFLNMVGGITKKIAKVQGVSTSDCGWYFALREANGEIKWVSCTIPGKFL